MSKSIFIIDTPACCGECPMSGTGVCRKWSMKEAKAFPKDCPLKPAYDKDKAAEELIQEFEKYYGKNWKEEPYLVKAIETLKSGKADERGKMGEEKYTIGQVIDAITQANTEITCANTE